MCCDVSTGRCDVSTGLPSSMNIGLGRGLQTPLWEPQSVSFVFAACISWFSWSLYRAVIDFIHDDAHDDVSQPTILLPHWLWRGKPLPPP